MDQLLQSGQKDEESLEIETPFLGVPFTIKDCFSVAGTNRAGKTSLFPTKRNNLYMFRIALYLGLSQTQGHYW